MKTRTKKAICWIVFVIAFFAILLPTNFGLNEWKFWSLILGGFGLYAVGRYEGQNGF